MINYSENIFGIDIENITINELQNYFGEAKLETDTLEFKSFTFQANFDELFTKILKTICGFLNGSGGLLILGAPSKTAVGLVDVFLGDLTPLPIQKSVDWFINKICSSISPMPINITVKIITIEHSYIYLFEVQESKYKPHQFNHIYYLRLDGQTKPAPHYIVQALMRQITYPDLRAVIRFNPFYYVQNNRLCKVALAIFNFSQLQNEENYNYSITLIGGAKFYMWQQVNFGIGANIILDGAQLIQKAIYESLHYGLPYIKSFTIIIPNNIEEISVMVSFGGKQSPSKVCIYKLNLEGVDENPQNNVIVIKENILFENKQTIDETLDFFRNTEII